MNIWIAIYIYTLNLTAGQFLNGNYCNSDKIIYFYKPSGHIRDYLFTKFRAL